MRSSISGDVLLQDAALAADVTGSWIPIKGKGIPFGGLPLNIFLLGGSTSGSAGSAKVTIQSSSDGSTVAETLFEKTYTLAVAAGVSNVDENHRIDTRLGYVRAVVDLTGTIDGNIDTFIGFVDGDIP